MTESQVILIQLTSETFTTLNEFEAWKFFFSLSGYGSLTWSQTSRQTLTVEVGDGCMNVSCFPSTHTLSTYVWMWRHARASRKPVLYLREAGFTSARSLASLVSFFWCGIVNLLYFKLNEYNSFRGEEEDKTIKIKAELYDAAYVFSLRIWTVGFFHCTGLHHCCICTGALVLILFHFWKLSCWD